MRAPKRLYLQTDWEGEPMEDEWTWCADQINETDVEYVRSDTIADLEKRLAEYENDETPRRRAEKHKIRMMSGPVLIDICNGSVDVFEQPIGSTVIALHYDEFIEDQEYIDSYLNVYDPEEDELYLVHIWQSVMKEVDPTTPQQHPDNGGLT